MPDEEECWDRASSLRNFQAMLKKAVEVIKQGSIITFLKGPLTIVWRTNCNDATEKVERSVRRDDGDLN